MGVTCGSRGGHVGVRWGSRGGHVGVMWGSRGGHVGVGGYRRILVVLDGSWWLSLWWLSVVLGVSWWFSMDIGGSRWFSVNLGSTRNLRLWVTHLALRLITGIGGLIHTETRSRRRLTRRPRSLN